MGSEMVPLERALMRLYRPSIVTFYRAMHVSATARSWDRMSSVCLSVRLSVTVDCDHV